MHVTPNQNYFGTAGAALKMVSGNWRIIIFIGE